ncbi:MAG: tripartite tricarboxylate transporter substrate binding protein [Betaproteobacteria bacterium]|nr:tripartite tricarboxylate transporter substrate binding protein [Betaproteobacteria bacterium]
MSSVRVLAAVLAVWALPCAAQNYPNKPVRMIVPFAAGGPTDILARMMAHKMTESWGQSVLIDNRGGGGGMIGADAAAKSAPDGYTIFLGGITTLVMSTYIHKNRPYDDRRDFRPVTFTTRQPLLLMAHPSLPVKSLKQFIALAQARPGDINYATSGPGGSGHLAGVLLSGMTKINIVHVPYRGAAPGINDLIAGQVQTMFGSPLAVVGHIRAGRIHALAITGEKRSAALPQVPTFAESGLPGYDASTWNGIVVPTGTPRPVIDRLHGEIVKVLRDPTVRERLAVDGSEPIGSTPEEFAKFIDAEHVKWGKVVRDAGIRIE